MYAVTKTKKSQGFPEQPGPLYDEMKPGPRYTDVPSEMSSDALVEMKMNIAYGPIEHAVAAGDNEIGKITYAFRQPMQLPAFASLLLLLLLLFLFISKSVLQTWSIYSSL